MAAYIQALAAACARVLRCCPRFPAETLSANVSRQVYSFTCSIVSLRVVGMERHWTAKDFQNELEMLSQLLKRRPGNNVVKNMERSLCERLQGMQTCTAECMLSFMDSLEKIDLPEETRSNVMKVLDSMGSQKMPGSHMKLVGSPQALTNVSPYLTATDWQRMEAGSTLDSLTVLAERLRRLGLQSLKEETKKHVVAIILYVHSNKNKPLPSPSSIYQLTSDFVAVFQSCMVNSVVQGVAKYPLNPLDMGDAWLAAAYGEEKPELKQVAVAAFLNKIPLRQTSSLLKAQPVQASAGSSGNCNAGNIVAQNFEKVMSAFMHSLQSRTSCDETEVNLDLLRPPAKKPKAIMDMSSHVPTPVRNDASPSHALEDKKDPPTSQSVLPMATEAPAPQTSVRPPASTKTAPEACLEDFEDAAYGTLKERKDGGKKPNATMKRPAARPKNSAKPKETTTKRGAASPSAKHGYPGKGGPFGCVRCRGNMRGCASCVNPKFGGLRFRSRAEWVAWYDEQQRSKK